MPRGDNAGRPTELTPELFSKIKQCILNGNDLRGTAKICKIVESTLYQWSSDNYLNLADKIEGWKRDRKVLLATKNLEDYLQMDTKNNIIKGDDVLEVKDTGLERIKADMTKFTLETLGKDIYSKRNELTGKDGGDLIIKTINYGNNDSDKLPAENISTTST